TSPGQVGRHYTYAPEGPWIVFSTAYDRLKEEMRPAVAAPTSRPGLTPLPLRRDQPLDEELQMAARIGRQRPAVDLFRQRRVGLGGTAAREHLEQRTLALHRPAQRVVEGNG